MVALNTGKINAYRKNKGLAPVTGVKNTATGELYGGVPVRKNPLTALGDLAQGLLNTASGTQTVAPNNVISPEIRATGPLVNGGAYNPYTGGVENIAGETQVNTGPYSPEEKQKLWQQSGQTGKLDTNAFFRKEDGTLGIKDDFIKSTNPDKLQTIDEANAYLNGVQNKKMGVIPETPQPTYISQEKTIDDLRGQYGMTNLESQAVDLDNQIAELQAQARQRANIEKSKPLEMGVIGGRISEIERQTNERLDQKLRERAYVTSQLQIKNGLIEQMMSARNLDFQNASNQWEKEFDRNLKLAELSRVEDQAEQTAEQKQLENARATVTTIYNTILSGGMDINKLSDSQKALISQMELRAGYPAGMVQSLYDKNPKGDIIYTGKETLADGNDYVTIITKDKMTGELKTDKILMGRSAAQKLKEEEQRLKTEAEKRKEDEPKLVQDDEGNYQWIYKPNSSMNRADRHNNPTAFTSDIAKQAGLVEGVDYEVGDPFGKGLNTAKLLGDPVETTIKVLDKIGFQTQGGQDRWTYTKGLGLTNEKWANMSKEEKVNAIQKMYKNENSKGEAFSKVVPAGVKGKSTGTDSTAKVNTQVQNFNKDLADIQLKVTNGDMDVETAKQYIKTKWESIIPGKYNIDSLLDSKLK